MDGNIRKWFCRNKTISCETGRFFTYCVGPEGNNNTPDVNDQCERTQLQNAVLKALLYYDIWRYPLSEGELYTFLPVDSLSYDEFRQALKSQGPGRDVAEENGYYFLRERGTTVVEERQHRERHADGLWRMARLSAHIIKRFPFVRAVFVSGDLSKNATGPGSDVDFFVITSPRRLWIARSLLILFKKIFLFNSRKYFCLNYFATEDHLALDEKNVFLATEIAHLKPLFNTRMFYRYLEQNAWISAFFPNFDISRLSMPKANDRRSFLQPILEAAFRLLPADRLDDYLLKKMRKIWIKRYAQYDEATHRRIFRSTRYESRAYVGNFQDKILDLYRKKLQQYGVVE